MSEKEKAQEQQQEPFARIDPNNGHVILGKDAKYSWADIGAGLSQRADERAAAAGLKGGEEIYKKQGVFTPE